MRAANCACRVCLIDDPKLEVVETAGVKVRSAMNSAKQDYFRHLSLANNLYVRESALNYDLNTRWKLRDAGEEAESVEGLTEQWTSAEGMAELSEEAGIFADFCPIPLLRADRVNLFCDISGCLGHPFLQGPP